MDSIKLDVTHSTLAIKMPELKFSRSQTIASVKMALEKRVGTSASSMELVLKDTTGSNIGPMDSDEATLGSYGPQDGYIIHVIDTNPFSITNQLSEEHGDIPKYKIEEEKYNARQDTFVKFKEKNPVLFKAKPKPEETAEAEQVAAIKVGNRCQILKTKARGEVKYVGKVPEKGAGYWIGVALDEPLGDSDGKYFFFAKSHYCFRVKGKSYFTINMKYGVFAKPSEVQVGDFPPEDIDEI